MTSFLTIRGDTLAERYDGMAVEGLGGLDRLGCPDAVYCEPSGKFVYVYHDEGCNKCLIERAI